MSEKRDGPRDKHVADYVHGVCRSMASFQQEVDEILATTDEIVAQRAREAQRELAPMRACPNCGESRQDHLWPLGAEVRCDECGQRYAELAPSRTPEQRAADARTAETDNVILNGVGLAQLERTVAKQAERIDDQNAWNGNQTREISRLARRIDRLEELIERRGGGRP